MAEIGAVLREARTRQRIEIAQMEAQTKIRAKYLRALENEEWELLPGPTYVKSFLKTYGDMLGLDGRALVAEYKSAHEPFQAADDIGQISKHTGGRMNRQQPGPPLARLIAITLVAVLVIGGATYWFLSRGDSGGDTGTPAASSDLSGAGTAVTPTTAEVNTPAAPKRVTVGVTATGTVTVCVRAGRRVIVRQKELSAGDKTRTARGKTVLVTTTNRAAVLKVNGKTRRLPSDGAAGPVTVSVTSQGVKRANAATTACRV